MGAGIWRMACRNIGRSPRRTGIVVTAVSVGLAGVLLAMAVNYGMVFQMVETAIDTEIGHLHLDVMELVPVEQLARERLDDAVDPGRRRTNGEAAAAGGVQSDGAAPHQAAPQVVDGHRHRRPGQRRRAPAAASPRRCRSSSRPSPRRAG